MGFVLGPCVCGRVLDVLSGFNFEIILLGKRLLYFNCVVTVCAVSFSHSAVGWSAFFDCSMSCAYPLTFLYYRPTVKPVQNEHSKKLQKLVLNTNYPLFYAGEHSALHSTFIKLSSQYVN